MVVSVYKHKADVIMPKYYHVDNVLESIRLCNAQEQITKIRNESDPSKKYDLKGALPSICFAGKFTAREDKYLFQHSGLCVIDIDHIGTLEKVLVRKEEIIKLPYVYACFISPSGDGLKVVVRIPPVIEKHRWHYTALMKLFPQRDESSINESRVCFASADADIYINKNAIEFTEQAEPKKKKLEIPAAPAKQALYTRYSAMEIPAKMVREAPDKEKYPTLLRAAELVGGYIAGGLVEETEGVRILEQEISGRDINNFQVAQKAIQDAVAHGKLSPIYKIEKPKRLTTPSDNGIIKPTDTVWENMKYTFRHGKKRGTTTHFKEFDVNFTWKSGEISLFIGRPNAGKSEFMYQLMLMKSYFDGWKWAVFTPENHPVDEFYDTMIHAYIGKTTDPFFQNYQMNDEEYERGYNFVKQHFFYVYPENPTMEEIESNFIYLIESEGVCGTFIDPFNHVNVDWGERDDKMLNAVLTARKRFAVKYNTCDVISAHPKNMAKTKDGNYDVPDIYDISGGAMWGNKMDNVLAVHRPNYIVDPKDSTVEIHVKKIKKQKLVGIPGTCTFDFSRKTNRYYQNGFNPLEPQPTQTKIPLRDYTEPRKLESSDDVPF